MYVSNCQRERQYFIFIYFLAGAGEELFYEAPSGRRQLIPGAAVKELAWQSPLTCPLDASLEGIWHKSMDLTDINAVATAFNLPLVAAASDNCGLLRLFSYPCLVSDSRITNDIIVRTIADISSGVFIRNN